MSVAVLASPFTDALPPAWASGWGQDEYGYYADFSIDSGDQYWEFITQRMRWIPPGTYLMGSPDDEPERIDNETLHTVTLTRGYWLADTACTQELWEAVMGSNPSRFPGPQRPVEKVSYKDVSDFPGRVNELVPGLNLALPTEAQWEYACRAGTTTPFNTGDQLTTDQANYNGNYPYNSGPQGEYREETVDVRTFSPNHWGLYQMHGNVWEWCRDWQDAYSDAEQRDPTGPATGSNRALRGGSWINNARLVRSGYRSWYEPGGRSGSLGVRCLSSVSESASQPASQLPNK